MYNNTLKSYKTITVHTLLSRLQTPHSLLSDELSLTLFGHSKPLVRCAGGKCVYSLGGRHRDAEMFALFFTASFRAIPSNPLS